MMRGGPSPTTHLRGLGQQPGWKMQPVVNIASQLTYCKRLFAPPGPPTTCRRVPVAQTPVSAPLPPREGMSCCVRPWQKFSV